MAIELRLVMYEQGHPDRTFVYMIDDKELALARKVGGDMGPFNSLEIRELNNRRGQHDLIGRAAALLGQQMADFRDDRDGWNGERRAEIIANARK